MKTTSESGVNQVDLWIRSATAKSVSGELYVGTSTEIALSILPIVGQYAPDFWVRTLERVFSDFVDDEPTQLQISLTESQRFGMSVGRLSVPFSSVESDDEIAQLCADSSYDLIIVRVSADRAGILSSLQGLVERSVLQADTLEYFAWDLSNLPSESGESLDFETHASNQFETIRSLVEVSFSGYRNHYSENPQLARSATVEGYLEWVERAMQAETSRMFLATKTGQLEPLGFIVADVNVQQHIAEVLLNGVDPAHRRQGVYQTCLIGAARALRQIDGMTKLVISTQSANTSVKAAWNQLGLRHWFDINTFHVMRTAT
jgi:ribosomal protein S18 acetylase RimI-like enzyme